MGHLAGMTTRELIGLLSGNYLKYLPILNVNDVNEPTWVVIEHSNERPLIHIS